MDRRPRDCMGGAWWLGVSCLVTVVVDLCGDDRGRDRDVAAPSHDLPDRVVPKFSVRGCSPLGTSSPQVMKVGAGNAQWPQSLLRRARAVSGLARCCGACPQAQAALVKGLTPVAQQFSPLPGLTAASPEGWSAMHWDVLQACVAKTQSAQRFQLQDAGHEAWDESVSKVLDPSRKRRSEL